MNERSKKALKISGAVLAALAAIFIIAMMFVTLGFFGAFGYSVVSMQTDYDTLAKIDLNVPIVSRPEGDFAARNYTVYTESVSNSKDVEKGKATCVAYDWSTPLDYFCVTSGDYEQIAYMFGEGEEAGSCGLGVITRTPENVYYAEKDGVYYGYIPVHRNCTPQQAVEIFRQVMGN